TCAPLVGGSESYSRGGRRPGARRADPWSGNSRPGPRTVRDTGALSRLERKASSPTTAAAATTNAARTPAARRKSARARRRPPGARPRAGPSARHVDAEGRAAVARLRLRLLLVRGARHGPAAADDAGRERELVDRGPQVPADLLDVGHGVEVAE